MTFEERLEAINQTLELTARIALDTERRLAERQEETDRDQNAARERITHQEETMIRLEETMTRQGDQVARFAEATRAWIETAERRFAELQEIARASSKRLEMLEARF